MIWWYPHFRKPPFLVGRCIQESSNLLTWVTPYGTELLRDSIWVTPADGSSWYRCGGSWRRDTPSMAMGGAWGGKHIENTFETVERKGRMYNLAWRNKYCVCTDILIIIQTSLPDPQYEVEPWAQPKLFWKIIDSQDSLFSCGGDL